MNIIKEKVIKCKYFNCCNEKIYFKETQEINVKEFENVYVAEYKPLNIVIGGNNIHNLKQRINDAFEHYFLLYFYENDENKESWSRKYKNWFENNIENTLI